AVDDPVGERARRARGGWGRGWALAAAELAGPVSTQPGTTGGHAGNGLRRRRLGFVHREAHLRSIRPLGPRRTDDTGARPRPWPVDRRLLSDGGGQRRERRLACLWLGSD